ncbi:hypothetical protein [Nonomuraea sp. NPDC049400]
MRLVGLVIACAGLLLAALTGDLIGIVVGLAMVVTGSVIYVTHHDGTVF